jgi:hypothetical protein
MDQARLKQIRDELFAAAMRAGKTIEEHAVDEIADLHTSARDSILRAAIVCSALGVVLGMYLGYVLFR